MILKRHKSISWKMAFGIVIFLHLLGYGAITQYGSYKKKLVQELKDRREKLYAPKESKPEWNNNHLKPQVVAVPTPQKSLEKENVSSEDKIKSLIGSSVDGVNGFLSSLDSIKNTFQKEVKKINNPFSKEITKPTISSSNKIDIKLPSRVVAPKPVVKNTTPKPIEVPKNVPSKPKTTPTATRIAIKTPPTPQPQKVTQIPIISEPSKQLRVRNIVIESDGSVVETSEETRTIVSSQVVL